MIKLVWTNWGSNLGIGIYCQSKKEGEQFFNCCYNYGAVSRDTRFHVLKNDANGCFGYFKSSWKELAKMKGVSFVADFLPKSKKEIEESREDFLKY